MVEGDLTSLNARDRASGCTSMISSKYPNFKVKSYETNDWGTDPAVQNATTALTAISDLRGSYVHWSVPEDCIIAAEKQKSRCSPATTDRHRSPALTCGATTAKETSPPNAAVLVHRAGDISGHGGRGRKRLEVVRRDARAGRRLAHRAARRMSCAGRPQRCREVDPCHAVHRAEQARSRSHPPGRRGRAEPGRPRRVARPRRMRLPAVDGRASAYSCRERLSQPAGRGRARGHQLAAHAGGGP